MEMKMDLANMMITGNKKDKSGSGSQRSLGFRTLSMEVKVPSEHLYNYPEILCVGLLIEIALAM